MKHPSTSRLNLQAATIASKRKKANAFTTNSQATFGCSFSKPTTTSTTNPGEIVAELEWCHPFAIVGYCYCREVIGNSNVDMISIGIEGITDQFLQGLDKWFVNA